MSDIDNKLSKFKLTKTGFIKDLNIWGDKVRSNFPINFTLDTGATISSISFESLEEYCSFGYINSL